MTVATAGAGSLAADAAGALIAIVAALDLFLTVFNYDGYTFISGRFQRALWRFLRGAARLLPQGGRHTALSIGSAAMLPATFAMWLGLEITGFALMYWRGISAGGFALKGAGASLGTAFYLSASGISRLTFGDPVPRGGLERAPADLETILGLARFTLALGYVVAAFGVLGALENPRPRTGARRGPEPAVLDPRPSLPGWSERRPAGLPADARRRPRDLRPGPAPRPGPLLPHAPAAPLDPVRVRALGQPPRGARPRGRRRRAGRRRPRPLQGVVSVRLPSARRARPDRRRALLRAPERRDSS